MKKTIVALMCMLLAVGAAMAQKTFTFGPKVGVDLTNFWGKDLPHGMQFNYQAGVFMEYHFTNKFSIAPEIVFAAQGGKIDITDYLDTPVYIKGSADMSFHFNYINLPIMLRFYAIPKLSIDFGHKLDLMFIAKQLLKQKSMAELSLILMILTEFKV